MSALDDAALVQEDETLAASGNVLANDTSPDGTPLSVASVNGHAVSSSGTTTITGTYGTLAVSADGSYTYTLANGQANVQALADGQTATDVFTYVLAGTQLTPTGFNAENRVLQSEAFNSSSWTRFGTVSITANNEIDPLGGGTTADRLTLSRADSGIYQDVAVQGQYTFSIWVRLVSGDGHFSFNYWDGADDNLQSAVATGTWQRFTFTFAGDGDPDANVAIMHDATQSASGIFEIWGAQLNPGPVAQQYMPTTTSAIVTTNPGMAEAPVQGTLTVDVQGTNEPAAVTTAADAATVQEDGTLAASGNVLANDTSSDGSPLSVASANGHSVASSGTTTITGVYGTLMLSADGTYTYTLANGQANVQALTGGQTATDVFTYTLAGATQLTPTGFNAENQIVQSEAFDSSSWASFGSAPVTANTDLDPFGGSTTADQLSLNATASGIYQNVAVQGEYTFSVWVKLVSGDGHFDLNYWDASNNNLQSAVATSTWQRFSFTFTGNGNPISNVAIMHDATQSASGVFEIWGAQLNPGPVAQRYMPTTTSAIVTTDPGMVETPVQGTLTVNVQGANEPLPPTAVADVATVQEDGTLTATGNVLANDTSPSGAALSVASVNGQAVSSSGATIIGTYGTLALSADGAYTYTLANGQANVQALAGGQTATDVFTYTLAGTSVQGALTVNVQGANEPAPPTAVADVATVQEDGTLTATGNVLANDTSPSGATLSVGSVNGQAVSSSSGVTIIGTYGTLALSANGVYTYTLANGQANVQALAAGQTATDVFTYTLAGTSIQGALTVNVQGANEPGSPTAVADVATVQEDGTLTATGNVLANDTSPSGATLSVGSVNGQAVSSSGATIIGTYGTLALSANGTYTYTLANGQANVQALAGGQTATDVFTYTLAGTSVQGALTVNVQGANEPVPPTAVADVATVQEDGTLTATGNVLANDTSPSGATLSVGSVNGQAVSSSGVTIIGTYGTLALSANGAYTYTLANGQANVQALAGGQTATDLFTYTLAGTSIQGALTVNVQGANEPGAAAAAPDVATVQEDVALAASGNVLANDTSPSGATLSVASVNGHAVSSSGTTTITGTYGTLILSADGTYSYTLANGQANVQALAGGQTATDVFTYTLAGATQLTPTGFNAENLILQSEAFNSSSWTRFGTTSITANNAVDPLGEGTTTADQLTLSRADSGIYQDIEVQGQYTFSIWVRLVSGDGHFSFNYWDGSDDNLQSAVATGTWQRFTFTFAGSGDPTANIALMHDTTQSASGVFELWGAQVNPGPVAQQYMPTTTSANVTTRPGMAETPVQGTLTVDVQGTNEPGAAATAADVALVQEDGTLAASGNVLANDTSPDDALLSIASVNGHAVSSGGTTTITGVYGTLVLSADGAYTYTLANEQSNVQGLVGGQTATDVFTYELAGAPQLTPTGFNAENQIVQSEAFNSSSWAHFGSAPVTADTDLDPFGESATADQLSLTGAASGIYQNVAVQGQYTFSVWVRLVSGDGQFTFNYWDASTDHLQSAVATSTWQRFSFTFTGSGNPISNVALMHDATQSTSGVFEIWGAQLNPGPIAQEYMPTTTSAIVTTDPGMVETPVQGTLTVDVQGADDPGWLSFTDSNDGVVANLATDTWANPIKIIPFGDSITYGWQAQDWDGINGQSNGYRGPLWWNFAESNSLIDFVGTDKSGTSLLLDQDHAGYPGEYSSELLDRAQGLATLLSQSAQDGQPQAVLLMAGTNDAEDISNAQTTIGPEIRSILNVFAQTSPEAHIYVATLIANDQAGAAKIAAMNSAISQAVSQAASDGLNVSLVNMSSITSSDLFDGEHPTEAGYAEMAGIWQQAILATQPVSGGTPGGTPHSIDSDIVSVAGSSFNDLLIGNSGNNQLSGGAGNDRLDGGGGNDVLAGGTGMDQFVFRPVAGSVVVQDFNQNEQDTLVFDGISGVSQFSDLASHISQSAGQTLIDFSAQGLHITLAGFTGTLTAHDVLFA